ncbi:N-acetylmuramoyl-L-alanine amidase [Methylotenera oryzisoli]|uniref:N-acetylmuramoyl-L-alanine amidase n=1 Tax=Methylotenera oryzisoli TaxID=2080758 RepID=A0A4Y9VQN6_9PROT|nr:N-acetylmuramoyl-L-alanine amidase [Methylotenera oryzisoli]TFW71416.1 N-acetylmuramoyl-L-alanine amidase [Methylotenera oryzisoli]
MKRTINAIVIHCAATPNGKAFEALDIDRMHKLRGFKRDSQAVRNFNPELKSIGYHFVVGVDGKTQTGRGLEEIGAHVQGSNAKSIGICMIGTDQYSQAQWLGLRECLVNLSSKILGRTILTPASMLQSLNDAGISIKGHRDYSPDLNGNGVIERNEWIKTCPGFDVAAWIKGGMVPLK